MKKKTSHYLSNSKAFFQKHRVQVAIVLLLFFLKVLLYILVTPPWMGPDETRHIGYIESLERRKERLYVHTTKPNPTLIAPGSTNLRQMNLNYAREFLQEDADWMVSATATEEGSRNWIVQHPPLYYALMTPVYAIFRDSASSLQIVCMLRIINAFIATATLYVIYRFAKEVTKNHTTSLIAIILFGSWPTFFHAAGYASNDILLTLLCGLLFYLVAKTNTYNLRTVIQLSVVTGLALCTKLFAVFMMPLVLVKLLMSHGKKLLDRKLITAVLLYTVSSLLIGGWYYAQNYVVTGDLVSADISKAEIGEAGEIVQDRHQMTYDDFDYEPYTWQGVKVVFSPNGLNLGYQWVRNYIGVFGWGQKPLRRDILFIFMGTYGLLLIAAIPALLKNKRYWVYFIPFLLLFSILIYKNYMSAFFWDGWIRALSGRYYLYSSIPIFTAMAIGYNSILQKLQYKNVAMLASMVVLFLIEWRIFIREIVVWIYF